MASIHDILRPINFTKVVSRVAAASSQFLNFMGMQVGGPNEVNYGHGREGFYHIFNNVRTVAIGTAPGSPAARRERNPVGRVPFVYPRMHQQLSLLLEEINNFAKIDDPGVRDIAGATYITKQMLKPSQEAANWRTALVVGMLRDSLYFKENGLNWYPTYSSSGALMQVSYQMPSGNKNQLNILDKDDSTSIYSGDIIGTPWTNPAANIPLHINRIDAAIFRRTGEHIRTVALRSEGWHAIIANDHVAAGAGIANAPFQTFDRQVGTNPDGSPFMARFGKVNTIPGIEFWICDEGLDIGDPSTGGTWNYHIEANHALFLPEISKRLFEGCIANEPIVEYDNGPQTLKSGQAAWTVLKANPSSYEAFILDNFFPIPYNPGSWAYADFSVQSSSPASE